MAYVGKKPADIIATAVDTTTGTFSGDLTVDTSTLYVDSANNRVGVGTVSPSKPLHVFNSGTSYVQISGNSRDLFLGQDATGGAIFSTGAVPMYFSTNSTERMRIDSSGNVGIGTSSPSAKLQVEGTLTVRSSSSQIFNDSANANNLTMNDSKVHFNIDGADKDFQVSSDTITNALFVQGSSGNVGIGTASPSTKLDIAGNITQTQTTQNIEFNQTNNAGTFSFKNRADISRAFISTNSTPMTLNVESADYLSFGTNNTERMRIDSSGNLLVGKTDQTANVAGTEIEGSGTIVSTRDNNTNMFLNRKTSDGNLIEFRKDNTTVGSIGTLSSKLTIGSGGTGVRFNYAGLDAIVPWNLSTNALTDGATSLGYASTRFTNLYLSGGVVFGSTSGSVTSKTLDDYEEGTWTPTMGGTATYYQRTGEYTKVGNKVFIRGQIHINAIGTGSTIQIQGLPFTSKTTVNGNPAGALNITYYANLAIAVNFIAGHITSASSNIQVIANAGNNTTIQYNTGNFFGNNTRLDFSMVYQVA